MTSAPLVRLERVGKRFGEGPAVLAGIDLTVERGDFVSIVGPSGCGKSTLLRLIAGLIGPSEGQIAVAGAAPASARDKMFFVFQDASLLPWRRTMSNCRSCCAAWARPSGAPGSGRPWNWSA